MPDTTERKNNSLNRLQWSGALALGAGLTASGGVQAELMFAQDCGPEKDFPITLTGNDSLSCDVTNDGIADLLFELALDESEETESATVSGRGFKDLFSSSMTTIAQGDIKGQARIFNPGDIVDDTFGFNGGSLDLYTGDQGPWGPAETTGYIGFRIDVRIFGNDFDISSAVAALNDIGLELEPREGIFFGFAQLTRGSLTLSSAAVQTTPGAGARIPGGGRIPVPATLALLATGAAGLLMRRRRLPAN